MEVKYGVIGGTGIYDIEGVEIVDKLDIDTPWGMPSSEIVIARIGGKDIAFLSRHGKGHNIPAHRVNYRANISALKSIGVEEIISFSAVGSLKEELRPLDFVVPTQGIDWTRKRENSFFGEGGIVAHISYSEPFCNRLSSLVYNLIKELKFSVHSYEALITIDGPRFSTKAESLFFKEKLGAGVINMSTFPEAILAREAGMCYAVVCMVTDYDCWYEGKEVVSAEMVVENLKKNSENAKKIIANLYKIFGKNRDCSCKETIKNAIISNPEGYSQEYVEKIRFIYKDLF